MPLKNPIDAVLQRAADAGHVPGVVAMVTNGRDTLYQGAFGKRALDQGQPMTLDTVGWIASMTKAVTATAALQLLERGKLDLDSPAQQWLPALGQVQVLEGFDATGRPRTRAPKQAITLRHLLTHTSGFGYEFLSHDIQKVQQSEGIPSAITCERAALNLPLLFDPGERWEYGIGLDWVGLIVEAVSGKRLGEYFAENILKPIGMHDTSFALSPGMRARKAKLHQRVEADQLVPLDLEMPSAPQVEMGGSGLYSTVGDYLKFTRMLLNRGAADHGRVLREETVDLLSRNQMGNLDVRPTISANRMLCNDMPLPPDNPQKWGLLNMINTKPMITGRSAGSLMWAGLSNAYYWIDPTRQIAGVFMTQVLPFADIRAMPLFFEFEYAVYQNL
ncbi:MAG: class A beta-lactamase-related serine hydrolase [Nevskiaceae bacterium]|nr:MAG: class A beta-lactamase-related serine hydrolase [Nevskiaceae bacterium]